jgi:tetratricopeptide (TPR) repeat protein
MDNDMKIHLVIASFSLLLSMLPQSFAADAGVMAGVDALSHNWVKVNYFTPKQKRVAAFQPLIIQAKALLDRYPDAPEAMIIGALVLSSTAAAEGGLDALVKVRQARRLLLQAEKINPQALDGAIYTFLGSLYAKVPGWPVSFGDQNKAREYLQKALKIDPKNIDANYFYADFLAEQGEYAEAVTHLQVALQAPLRAGHEDADTGRRHEAVRLLDKINVERGREIAAH